MAWHVTPELWLFLSRIQNTYIRTNGLSFMMADSIRVGHDIASRVNADQCLLLYKKLVSANTLR
jgi:hypothetical protein